MPIARKGVGTRANLRALGSQIHPVFMLPPFAASWFGAVVAGDLALGVGFVHAITICFAVYVAHVKDGYVDFYRRDEDEDHPLTRRGCGLALAGATLGFAACLGVLAVFAGPVSSLLTLPTWLLGYLHAPQFDTNPVTTTLGYPTGIALAILGGFHVQAGGLDSIVLGYAAVFVIALAGVKIIDDEQDFSYDQSIDKQTVAVALGRARARLAAFGLLGLSCLAVLWGAVSGLFPASAPAAALVFASVGLVARRARPKLATMLLVRGSYLFLAILVVTAWYQPLAPVALPSIAVLGPYTYLATEVVFGSLAVGLLVYANAVRTAVRTVLALYPLAYVWDWYTLEIGVFAIRMRTGYDLFGIPIEEHLFMLVVPGLVIGLHEAIRRIDSRSEMSAKPEETTQ